MFRRWILVSLLLQGYPAHAADGGSVATTFVNQDIELAATLLIPHKGQPSTALVLLHGSGPGPRGELLDIARGFARRGVAVLVYDKRGSGESQGNWVTSGLAELTQDACAARRHLMDALQLDSQFVGFWGISQGGWLVPLAIEKCGGAFGIVITGGGLPPRQIELHRYRMAAERAGLPRAEVPVFDELVDTYMRYLGGVVSRSELDRLFDQNRHRVWFAALGIEDVVPSERNRHNWEWVASFDPTPGIARLQTSMLVLLGEDDHLVPASQAAAGWRQGLSDSGASYSVRVISGANHGLRQGGHSGRRIDGFFDLQVTWINATIATEAAEK